jgi:hypothetical protein
MTLTRETINGKEYNVVWHDVKPTCLNGFVGVRLWDESIAVFLDDGYKEHIATAQQPTH